MNVPNFLTILRILAIPALVVVLLTPFEGREVTGFAIFLFASLTDMLDGFFARRKKLITVLGQLLDPTADKLLITAAIICLVEIEVVPGWMAIVIIGREIAVSGFRAIASSRGINIPAGALGKMKMSVETITLCLLILGKKYLGKLYAVPQAGLWLAILLAVVSAVYYYIKYWPQVASNRP